MIDEMMTLLESDDEAKALTFQITGHKDLLSSRDAHIQAMRKSIPELDESVTNAIVIRQMQQSEFVTALPLVNSNMAKLFAKRMELRKDSSTA